MSEYRHFIAYIYEYEDGKKTKNAGFVKVHMRNGVCRIQLKLQSSVKELTECQICGFFHEGEWLYGIPMGILRMKGGICEGNVVTAESVFQEKGYTFAQISGLWIKGRNVENQPERTFLTVWDERPVDSHRLTMERPEDSLPDMGVSALAGTGADLPEIGRTRNTEQTGVGNDERSVERIQNNQAQMEAQNLQPGQTDGCSLDGRWEQFQLHYPHTKPFADEEITECIQIAPKDITFLGKKERYYATCPFVRQKYMKYQHLLLGKHETGRYILAVPGVNRGIQDQNLAAMYGFPEYKEAEGKGFGYWYHFL